MRTMTYTLLNLKSKSSEENGYKRMACFQQRTHQLRLIQTQVKKTQRLKAWKMNQLLYKEIIEN
jgi:hypothetical protein